MHPYTHILRIINSHLRSTRIPILRRRIRLRAVDWWHGNRNRHSDCGVFHWLLHRSASLLLSCQVHDARPHLPILQALSIGSGCRQSPETQWIPHHAAAAVVSLHPIQRLELHRRHHGHQLGGIRSLDRRCPTDPRPRRVHWRHHGKPRQLRPHGGAAAHHHHPPRCGHRLRHHRLHHRMEIRQEGTGDAARDGLRADPKLPPPRRRRRGPGLHGGRYRNGIP
mmetsp:Transcript_10778/g.29736  ORF Transcript_10778/g.29736 Transcript_10778/m.29736 type:complete len:223 (-) Transcript_10778:728-1396(-)